jgi:hypothetical protein
MPFFFVVPFFFFPAAAVLFLTTSASRALAFADLVTARFPEVITDAGGDFFPGHGVGVVEMKICQQI